MIQIDGLDITLMMEDTSIVTVREILKEKGFEFDNKNILKNQTNSSIGILVHELSNLYPTLYLRNYFKNKKFILKLFA